MNERMNEYRFSLSSRDRTPVKSPSKSTMILRSTPRKRLSLGDSNETRFTVSEKKRRTPSKSMNVIDSSMHKKFNGNLVNGLRGLSHEQLVNLITDVISMQEDGNLREDEKLKDVFMNKMPMADVQPQREKLCNLRQNIYASLVSSNTDDCAYSRAYIHLDAFQVWLRNFTTQKVKYKNFMLPFVLSILCFVR